MAVPDDLERRLAALEAREREVERRERGAAAAGLKHNLYARVNLSVRAVDAIIVACAVSIAALVALGWFLGRG